MTLRPSLQKHLHDKDSLLATLHQLGDTADDIDQETLSTVNAYLLKAGMCIQNNREMVINTTLARQARLLDSICQETWSEGISPYDTPT